MKARVDLDLCEAYGTCANIAPDVFKLDEWGYAHVEDDGKVPAGQEGAAREAALSCPMRAIALEEDG